MKQVTQAEFFGKLYANQSDIMPSIDAHPWPYSFTWKNVRTREVFGVSQSHKFPKETDYFLVQP